MATITRRRKESRLSSSLLINLIAVVFGIVIGSCVVLVHFSSSFDQSTSSTLSSISSHGPAATKVLNHDGFHPIYVYRGNSQAINSLDPPKGLFTRDDYSEGSQVDQDKIISALIQTFQNKYTPTSTIRTPYFIDLAANDAIYLSNTLHLERNKEQSWDGLCIEPNGVYWYRLAHRKCTVVAAFMGGKQDMEEIHVRLGTGEYGGIVGRGYDNKRKKETDEKRYSVSISTVFDEFDVPDIIDYMSLDVEGAEELIMKDFPFSSYKCRFITVERPKPSLQQLLKDNGYQFVMLLVYWGESLWVHESVLQAGFQLEEIQTVAHANSKFTKRKPNIGSQIFNIETGDYVKYNG